MKTCALCGAQNVPTERHHIFGGARRKLSEEYGLVVDLCHWCHNEPPAGVHHNKKARERLQAQGQRKAMREQGWSAEDFCAAFGKNYVDEDEPGREALPAEDGVFVVLVAEPLPVWW
jgi:hypothetical protein